jgi:hypothetical protein
MRRRAILLSTVLLLAACGGSSKPGSSGPPATIGQGARSTSDVFEVDVSFDAPWSRNFGSSREWYSPDTGLYRAELRRRGKTFASVYNGSTITRQADGKVFRAEGERAMLRFFVERPNIFETPGLVGIRNYLDGFGKPDFHTRPHDGGRSLRVDWHFVDDGIDAHIHYTVRILSRVHLRTARNKGLFAPLTGPLSGELKQSAPGTHPHFGEQALWFGPALPGGGKAVTAYEKRGANVFTGEEGTTDVLYTTMYRLPRSVLPPGAPTGTTGTYPGLGDDRLADLRIDCVPKNTRFGSFAMTGPSSPITLANGTRAQLYAGDPSRFAVKASSTVCQISSWGGTDRLRRFARRLRPL